MEGEVGLQHLVGTTSYLRAALQPRDRQVQFISYKLYPWALCGSFNQLLPQGHLSL